MAPIPATLRDANNSGELMSRLQEIAFREGEVRSIRFFCGSREPDAILVLIDAGESSQRLTLALNGLMFGGVAAFRIFPVGGDFNCGGRRNGQLIGGSCDSCNYHAGAAPAAE